MELQLALAAASQWRQRFHQKPNGPALAKEVCSESTFDTYEKSEKDTDVGMSSCADSCSSIDEDVCEESHGAFWVHCAFSSEVSSLLSQGIWGSTKQTRLFEGSGRRQGLCRRGEDVLVYVDRRRALLAGVLPNMNKTGFSLPKGSMIPGSCIYKMTSVVDGRVLYDRCL